MKMTQAEIDDIVAVAGASSKKLSDATIRKLAGLSGQSVQGIKAKIDQARGDGLPMPMAF